VSKLVVFDLLIGCELEEFNDISGGSVWIKIQIAPTVTILHYLQALINKTDIETLGIIQ
jgi:hypothetical protein